MKENDYCEKCRIRDYCAITNIGCTFSEVYEDGYIAGLKEMYSVLSAIVPSDVLKNFDVDEYIQTKTQQR